MLWVRFHFTHSLEFSCICERSRRLFFFVDHASFVSSFHLSCLSDHQETNSLLSAPHHTLSVCDDRILLRCPPLKSTRLASYESDVWLNNKVVLRYKKQLTHRGPRDKNSLAHTQKHASNNKLPLLLRCLSCVLKDQNSLSHVLWPHSHTMAPLYCPL